MSQSAATLDCPRIALAAASASEYCESVLAAGGMETWWWQQGLARFLPYRGFSRPFRDHDGRWWWRPKPQFAWTMDFFEPLERAPRFPRFRSVLGCQYPVREEQANSLAHFNMIQSVEGYDLDRVASQKRRAIRKGVSHLGIVPLDPNDRQTAAEACEVWNSHVDRTGWSRRFDGSTFAKYWRPLADMAATSVLGARDSRTGVLCAWLIARVVEGTAYVDTIASHSDRLEHRPNDTLIFVLLYNAARSEGVRHAHYFLRSALDPLEKFKQSLGFDSSGVPARVEVHWLAAWGLRRFKPQIWRRLHGDWPSVRAAQFIGWRTPE